MKRDDFIEIKGKEIGKTSIILVGVHGNEVCGIEAIEELLPNLDIQTGTVLIGYGNPVAIEKNVRFTEANLNRMFNDEGKLTEKDRNSYEYKRAQHLKQQLQRADALLDIHASATPQSKPFIICEKNAEGVYKILPFDLIVHGFDSVEPGGTDYYMNKIGKVGICAECGYLGDLSSKDKAKETILNFLTSQEHIGGKLSSIDQKVITMKEIYITKTNNFSLAKKFSDFEELKGGTQIGNDSGEEIIAPYDGVILFARNRNSVGEEGFLFGE